MRHWLLPGFVFYYSLSSTLCCLMRLLASCSYDPRITAFRLAVNRLWGWLFKLHCLVIEVFVQYLLANNWSALQYFQYRSSWFAPIESHRCHQKICNLQGVAHHWHNPVRTRVTHLDSSDALYIVFLAYTVKHMDTVVRFRHPCVGPVRFMHAPIISLTCSLYPRTYCWFSLCFYDACTYY